MTPLFVVLFFFLQAPVDWFGWVPLTGLSWLPSRLTCGAFQFHHAPSPHHLLPTGMQFRQQSPSLIEYGAVLGFSIFYSTFPIVNHFAHVAMLLSHFSLPALPSAHFSTEGLSVTVPAQCHSWGCHSYFLDSLATPISFTTHLSHTYLLSMGLV